MDTLVTASQLLACNALLQMGPAESSSSKSTPRFTTNGLQQSDLRVGIDVQADEAVLDERSFCAPAFTFILTTILQTSVDTHSHTTTT